MKSRALAAVCIVLWASTAWAQVGHVGLYADAGGTDVEVFPTLNHSFNLYVVLTQVPSALGAEFKVDVPAGFWSNVIDLGSSSPFYMLGSPYNGVSVDFGSCQTTPVLVATLYFAALGDVDCSQLQVVADPNAGTGSVMTLDCSGQPLPATGGIGYVWTGTPGLVNRTPADGATGVPTNVVLHWAESYCFEGYGDCFSQFCSGIYFGTESDPPYAADVASSYDPGGLQPNTTYYWWVGAQHVGSTPIWSFTTGAGPVAVERSTWGSVKALYQ